MVVSQVDALPRVVVASDGTLAAIQEPERITLIELPGGMAFAEIGVDPEATASEVAWLGSPPRLLVLSRYDAYSTVHLLDPSGPRSIAEIRLEAPVRIAASVGNSALVIGGQGAAVLTATETHVMPYPFPARSLPLAAGGAANQFVVALASSIEEWDPASRMPKRRLRLPRAAAITAVGGTERIVWMTTQQEPARIDVIPLVNRGQPKAHDLPEPIAAISSHPRSDLLACIGAESGRLYIVDLDGRAKLRVIGPEAIDRVETTGLIVGRMVGVIAAQAGRPIAIIPLDGRDIESDPALLLPRPVSSLFGDSNRPASRLEEDPPPAPSTLSEPPEAIAAKPPTQVSSIFRHGAAQPPTPPRTAARAAGASASERFSAWRDQLRHSQPPGAPDAAVLGAALAGASTPMSAADDAPDPAFAAGAPEAAVDEAPASSPVVPASSPIAPASSPAIAVPASSPVVPASSPAIAVPAPVISVAAPALAPAHAWPSQLDPRASWRDDLIAWAYAVSVGRHDPSAPPPPAPIVDAIVARFELSPAVQPALCVLYAAHLCGQHGAAPIDLARVLDRQWSEALGRGELAQRDLTRHAQSRVHLAPTLLRVLDQLPPLTGVLVGDSGTTALLGPCVVVPTSPDEDLPSIAARCLPHAGGAVLIAHASAPRAELLFEARAYGAAPLLRGADLADDPSTSDAAIYIVDDETAERLSLPRFA